MDKQHINAPIAEHLFGIQSVGVTTVAYPDGEPMVASNSEAARWMCGAVEQAVYVKYCVCDHRIMQDLAHPVAPIDLAAEILAKDQRNRTRGYRHGGKLA